MEDGTSVGLDEGIMEGTWVGVVEGKLVGIILGINVGNLVGLNVVVGTCVGKNVGAFVSMQNPQSQKIKNLPILMKNPITNCFKIEVITHHPFSKNWIKLTWCCRVKKHLNKKELN